jgi:hypothetical protein
MRRLAVSARLSGWRSDMDEAARKRHALLKIGDVLWEIDDGDVMVIVAALIEHAASTAVTAWGVEKARATMHELLDQAFVSEEIFETTDFAKANRAWRKEIGND